MGLIGDGPVVRDQDAGAQPREEEPGKLGEVKLDDPPDIARMERSNDKPAA
jgi:hypothetical protein